MAGRGRPTKRTPETERLIVQLLRVGATRQMAARSAGICEDTLLAWVGRHPDFLAAVQEAEAQARTDLLLMLRASAKNGSVKAQTWLLERLEPETFGPPAQTLDVNIAWEELETHELERLAAGPSRAAAHQGPRYPRITEAKAG